LCISARWSVRSSSWTRSELLTKKLWKSKSTPSSGHLISRLKSSVRDKKPKKRKNALAIQWRCLIGRRRQDSKISSKRNR